MVKKVGVQTSTFFLYPFQEPMPQKNSTYKLSYKNMLLSTVLNACISVLIFYERVVADYSEFPFLETSPRERSIPKYFFYNSEAHLITPFSYFSFVRSTCTIRLSNFFAILMTALLPEILLHSFW